MASLTTRRRPPEPGPSTRPPPPTVENHFRPSYPHRLNFYDKPPLFDVTLEQFETWALARLRILAEIESAQARNRPSDEVRVSTLQLCKKYLSLSSNSNTAVDLDGERRRDHVSHFVLRLAFCRGTEGVRRRYVNLETTLFRLRYESDDTNERQVFLGSRDFGWIEVSKEEKAKFEKELRTCTPPSQLATFPQERFYKVRWTRVPRLVESRRVFLKGGMAYVPSREQSSFIIQEFQSNLEDGLLATAKVLPRLDEDRLTPILDHLSKGFVAGVPSELSAEFESSEVIRADQVEYISKHFPLCMRAMHINLRKDHHLKHQGRIQYGLFLKAIGLPIDEALAFWRKSFQGYFKAADGKFEKEYVYNIKHSYGLVGRQHNYTPRSCATIITITPGSDENHGCPFRHYSEPALRSALESMMGVSGIDLIDVMSLVKGNHLQVACTRVFEITHGLKRGEGLRGETVEHPNVYTSISREMEQAKNGVEEKAGPKPTDGAQEMTID